MEGEYSGAGAQDNSALFSPSPSTLGEGRGEGQRKRAHLAGVGVLEPGTRNCVWQCWHLTILPRTSSGTTSSLRHLRLGQIS